MGFIQNYITRIVTKQLDSKFKTTTALQAFEGGQNIGDMNFGAYDNAYSQINFDDSWVKHTEYLDNIHQIDLRYNKKAPFGAATVKAVVQFLSSWSIKDVTITSDSDDEESNEFIEYWANQVCLERFVSELSTRAELQGHVLINIHTSLIEGEVKFKLSVLPLKKYKYKLKFDAMGFYEGYTYTTQDNGTQFISKDVSEFFPVYGFDSDYINSEFPLPSIGYVIEHCDTIDKCRENIRHTNKFFAKKTPVISTDTQLTANNILSQIEQKDWNTTSFLVAPQIEMKQIGADNEGVAVLIVEILSSMQAISGTCGVPIDKLGYPEQFSSQSVRLENSESINVNAAPKRIIYKDGLESLLSKCVVIYNKMTGKTLDPLSFKVTINESVMSLQERKAVMLNDAYDRGVIDKQYYLENHPIIGNDAIEILERIEEQDALAKEELNSRMSSAIDAMGAKEEKVKLAGETDE